MAVTKPLSQRFKTFSLKAKSLFGADPIWQVEAGQTVSEAFVHGGIQYYQVHDIFNTNTLRGTAAVEVYDKWNMRMSRDTLQEYLNEMKKVFVTPKVMDVGRIVTLVNSMQERMDYILSPEEYLWDLFCVNYFDASESPYGYDPEYQIEKKRRFKSSGNIDAFFLYTRLSELLPLPKLSEQDLMTAFRVISGMEELQSMVLSGQVPQDVPNRSL